MKVEISNIGEKHFEVWTERHNLLGHIYEFQGKPFSFKWSNDTWKELTPKENETILAAVTLKITLLNITRKLTR